MKRPRRPSGPNPQPQTSQLAYWHQVVDEATRDDATREVAAANRELAASNRALVDVLRAARGPATSQTIDPSPSPLPAADTRQVEADAGSPVEPLPPPPPPPPKAKSRRGRKAYDIWDEMFAYLDKLVVERGRLFKTYSEAAGYGLEFLKLLAETRRKASQGAAVPGFDTIREKISELRPDLVAGNCG